MPRAVHKPRLLILTPDFPPAHGGIQVMAHELAVHLEGFDRKVVALACAGAASFDSASALATRRVNGGRRLRGAQNVALNLLALREALRFRPELTLSMHIVTSPAAACIRRLLGARTVQYFHAKEIADKPRLARFAAEQAHVVIAVSAYCSDLISDTGAAPASVRLISPGVRLPADPSPLALERPTFVTIARLEDRFKGHDVLIAALARVREKVPDVEWVVIGDGPLRGSLEGLARSAGVADSVRFLGAVEDAERDRWLRGAHLLAMPSRLPGDGSAGEGFGIVYLEAAAYGKPVVAGNVAGALDSVAAGESGLLVDPADAGAVAEAIASLLLDPELAHRLGRAGAERAQRYAWPLVAARLGEVLLEQAGELARPRLEKYEHAP
ncbi:MAG: glycosyltransferase family 4 protein [Actinomycetota bacterium]|nr:glycosyltransferase family 4 protein [Actinomycetota bacterium]